MKNISNAQKASSRLPAVPRGTAGSRLFHIVDECAQLLSGEAVDCVAELAP